jgi:hypothetical protein
MATVAAVGLLVTAGAVIGYVREGVDGEGAVFVLGAVSMFLTGAILVLKVPDNALSWLVLAVATGLGIMTLFDTETGPGAMVGGLALFLIVLPGLGVYLPLWFPTGRPPTPRWRWVSVMTLVGALLIPVSGIVVDVIEGGNSSDIQGCTSIATCLGSLGLLLLLLGVVAAIVSLVFRWIGSRGVERFQMKWLVLAFGVFLIGVLAEFAGFQDSIVANIFLPAGLLLIPVTIVVAVTRYRLYEIDRILSRTVTYTAVVVLLAAVYFGGITVTTVFLPSDSPLAVAASTLAVAALFNPLRRRVQGWVDRRFNRSRFDTQQIMDEFAETLRDGVDSNEMVRGWIRVVSETMHPASAGAWVRERDERHSSANRSLGRAHSLTGRRLVT